MPAVPKQLPSGSQNDAGDHERIRKSPEAPSGLPARWVPHYLRGVEEFTTAFCVNLTEKVEFLIH